MCDCFHVPSPMPTYSDVFFYMPLCGSKRHLLHLTDQGGELLTLR